MEREGFDIPLLIGGATTSRVHTAVKIHPHYARGQTVHVNDASRAVGVVGALLSPDAQGQLRRDACAPNIARSPTRTRAARPTRRACRWPRRAPTPSRSTGPPTTPPKPSFLGARVLDDWDLAELARYIDWTPFFQTWELKGRYPAILDDEKQGEAARQLFDDAQAMLKRIIAEKWFAPKAVVGFWPAGARRRRHPPVRRRQPRDASWRRCSRCASSSPGATGAPNVALADFVAPLDSGKRDYVGALRRHGRRRGGRRSPSASRWPTTTIRRSWSRRSPTVSPRRSPRRCTRGCAANCGATRPTRSCRPTT